MDNKFNKLKKLINELSLPPISSFCQFLEFNKNGQHLKDVLEGFEEGFHLQSKEVQIKRELKID